MDDRTTARRGVYRAQGRAQVPAAAEPAVARWGTRIYKGVLGVGALAAAVTAVLVAVQAVRPVDKEDFAAFKTITVSAGVPYEEYQQRNVPPHPVQRGVGWGRKAEAIVRAAATLAPPRLVEPVEPVEPGEPAGPGVKKVEPTPATTTPSPQTSGTPTPDPSPTRTSQKPARGPLVDPHVRIDQDSMRLLVTGREAVKPDSGTVDEICGRDVRSCPALNWLIFRITPIDEAGRRLESATAVNRRYREIVRGSRTTYVKEKGKKSRKQMIGVVVDVNLELSGLRGKPVQLSWSLWRKGGTKQIYGTWLNDNLTYELTAGSEHDSASVNFWIPLPKAKGSYIVRSKLTRDGRPLASVDSEPIS